MVSSELYFKLINLDTRRTRTVTGDDSRWPEGQGLVVGVCGVGMPLGFGIPGTGMAETQKGSLGGRKKMGASAG